MISHPIRFLLTDIFGLANFQLGLQGVIELFLIRTCCALATARRMLICGMHVHVGLDDDELRIDLLSQMARVIVREVEPERIISPNRNRRTVPRSRFAAFRMTDMEILSWRFSPNHFSTGSLGLSDSLQWRRPQIDLVFGVILFRCNFDYFLNLDAGNLKMMRNDPRTRFELFQLR